MSIRFYQAVKSGLFGWLFLVAGLLALPAQAQNSGHQAQLAYKVYVGGVRMFNVSYNMSLDAHNYQAQVKVKAKGLGKIFANITLIMTSNGAIAGGRMMPQSFSYYNRKRKRKRTADVFWDGGMPQTNRTWPISDMKRASLVPTLRRDLVDPITAFLALGSTSATKGCNGSRRIYDGSVVYDLQFRRIGQETFKSGGSYNGPAIKCQITHFPVGGYSPRGLEKARRNPARFTVWLVPVELYEIGRKVLLPVGATGRIKGKGFSAVPAGVTLDGQPI